MPDDIDIELGPLDARAASARIAALEAKNNAKTPLGASLREAREISLTSAVNVW